MGKKILMIIKCSLLSVIITVVLIFILSVLSYFTAINEKTLTVLVYASTILSVFLGAFIITRLCDSKPLVYALLQSVIYYAILVIITLIINKNLNLNSHFYTMTAGIFASGILGAVLGK